MRARGSRGRRTWPQRLLIAFNICCILGALGSAGALGYLNAKLGEVVRIGGLSGTLRSAEDVPAGAPENYLLVGADDDTGLGPDDPITRGRDLVGGARTDTIIILRLDPDDSTAQMLSLPRDLWVPIAGQPGKSRINEAFETGGVKGLITTITMNFGIPIDHYVQMNFAGFKELVQAIDGVPVYFPEPVRDRRSFLDVPVAGCRTLDPDQALAFARARYYEVFRDGDWEFDPGPPDLGRISRQQFFIQKALSRAVAKGVRNPNKLRQLIDLGTKSVSLDEGLRVDDLVDLGQRFRRFNPENLVKYSVPVVDAVHGGAEVLELVEADAEPILALFRGEPRPEPAAEPTAPAIEPAQVRVQVSNGSRVAGQAAEVTQAFADLGFAMATALDAPQDFAGQLTTLRYAPGRLAQARLVARYLTGAPVFEEQADLEAADVAVITAADWQGTLLAAKDGTEVSTPTSTAPPTSDDPAGTTTPDTAPADPSSTTVTSPVPGEAPPGQSCG
ncbi:MAG: LCP family protein [Acidimicrobiales bacterium]